MGKTKPKDMVVIESLHRMITAIEDYKAPRNLIHFAVEMAIDLGLDIDTKEYDAYIEYLFASIPEEPTRKNQKYLNSSGGGGYQKSSH